MNSKLNTLKFQAFSFDQFQNKILLNFNFPAIKVEKSWKELEIRSSWILFRLFLKYESGIFVGFKITKIIINNLQRNYYLFQEAEQLYKTLFISVLIFRY